MKKKISIILVLTTFISLSIGYTISNAASNVSVTVNVPSAGRMTVPGSLALNSLVETSQDTVLNITGIKTNTAWNITVYKDADLTAGTDVIPSSQLTFTSASQGSAIQFPTSGSPATVASGAKSGSSGTTTDVTYKLALTYDDNPGAYAATHVYTLNTP